MTEVDEKDNSLEDKTQFITRGESRYAFDKVKWTYRPVTEEVVTDKLKNEVMVGIRRKYAYTYKLGMKIVME